MEDCPISDHDRVNHWGRRQHVGYWPEWRLWVEIGDVEALWVGFIIPCCRASMWDGGMMVTRCCNVNGQGLDELWFVVGGHKSSCCLTCWAFHAFSFYFRFPASAVFYFSSIGAAESKGSHGTGNGFHRWGGIGDIIKSLSPSLSNESHKLDQNLQRTLPQKSPQHL